MGRTLGLGPRLGACLGLAAAAVGCAGRAPPSPPVLGYRVEAPTRASFTMSDTVDVRIEALGQSFALEGGARSTWAMELAPDSAGVRVTASLVDLDARMSNPLGPGRTVDETGVSGPIVFLLGPRGHATLLDVPEIGPAAGQFVTGATLAHGFFPRLPARPVSAGESWVDTVTWEGAEAGTETSVRTVWTYRVVGDSVLDGSSFQLVRATGETEQSSVGSVAGAEFTQEVAGTVEGFFLWDPRERMLHTSEYRGDLAGRTEMSIAPVPLDVRVRSVVRVIRTPEP